ncbi:hypothetical protein B5S31_g4922 [[Candida] boidinii]|nr:hypothetical protein B5S31_g4922 [[Candida] boidinii]
MATLHDPWKKRDAWRYQGVFSKSQKFRGLFPGLFWGIGAFAIVSVYEDYIAPKPAAHGHALEKAAEH